MLKLLVIADVEGWAYDRRAKALRKYSPGHWSVDIAYANHLGSVDFSKYDVVFNIEYWLSRTIRQFVRNSGSEAVLVTSHNADHRRCHELFEQSYIVSDFITGFDFLHRGNLGWATFTFVIIFAPWFARLLILLINLPNCFTKSSSSSSFESDYYFIRPG